ncbi:MAG: glycine cleavage system protein GcvH [Thermoprotei archaeon]|nr:glycine cleavage system protein GcvH [Thermoprotei archaeon]
MVEVDGYLLMEDRYYWPHGHTWVKLEGDKAIVGMTHLGIEMAGRIIMIRLRPKGSKVKQGEGLGTLESAKWVGPIESPITGEVIEVNKEVRRRPRILSKDPYEKGWMAILKPLNLEEDMKKLLTGEEAVKWYKEEVEKWKSRK